MSLLFSVCVDWDADGDFATGGDDITAQVIALDIHSGFAAERDHLAAPGECVITVANEDRRFSPANTGGPLVGKLRPNLPVRVQASSGGATWTLFRGYTRRFQPEPGAGGSGRARIVCQDVLGLLARDTLSLPLQENQAAGALIRLITAEIFRGGVATSAITPAANTDWIEVHGTRFSFVSALSGAADEVLNDDQRAANVAAAINGDLGAGTIYGAGTDRQTRITAALVDDQTVELAANARGAWGNDLTTQTKLSGSAPGAAVNFSGGSDAPAGLLDLDTGEQTFALAADRWDEERTTGLAALRDVAHSEFGYAWAARDGRLVFRSRLWEFARPADDPVLVVNGTATDLSGALDEDRVHNRIVVTYTPHGELSAGVIARAQNGIVVPGRSGLSLPRNGRWNRAVGYVGDTLAGTPQTLPPEPGQRLVRLPFVQPESGQVVGARDVILPVAGTDYTVNDARDGTGFDYTHTGRITISMALTGSGVELSFQNTALGPLYVQDLQVRGAAIIAFDAQQAIRERDDSINTYGKRTLRHDLPLESGEVFADAVADYLLGRGQLPAYVVDTITFDGPLTVDGVNVFSVEIGDVIALSEAQTGISDHQALVRGMDYTISEGGACVRVTLRLKRLDDVTYWLLADAAYGVLGSTTRLAL